MLPFPFKQIHNALINATGFCITPKNNHLVSIKPDDTFLVSYPKSGNTWVRFILSNLMFPDSITDFKNIDSRIPDVHNLNGLKILRASEPRILKSHFAFKPEYPKVIYIVRDPRSVAISEYHYLQRVGNPLGKLPFDEFFPVFLKGHNRLYGNWGEHVYSWYYGSQFNKGNFMIIRYEDMLESTEVKVQEMADFLNFNASEKSVQEALKKSSFEEMKKLEQKTDRHKKSKIPFVRKGDKGEWQNMFTENQEAELNDVFKEPLKLMGYSN